MIDRFFRRCNLLQSGSFCKVKVINGASLLRHFKINLFSLSSWFRSGWLALLLLGLSPAICAAATADVRVGSVSVASGQTGTVSVFLNTGSEKAISMQIFLTYDGSVLTPILPSDNPRATAGPAMPAFWSYTANSPTPGEMRVLAVDFSGVGTVFNGDVILATFQVAAGAVPGTYPVRINTAPRTTAIYDFNNTRFTLSVTDGGVTVTAPSVAPAITTQPANQTVTVGQTVTFSVVATGTAPLSYQWQKGGVNISGGTSASYTTPVTVLSDSGSVYRCVVTNVAGSVTSTGATLTVNGIVPGTVDLRAGAASIRPGEVGAVPVYLDTRGTVVISMQIYLRYDSSALSPVLPGDNPRLNAGSALPTSWSFVANSAVPGEVRFLLVDFSGVGQAFNGEIISAKFLASLGASAGSYAVRIDATTSRVYDFNNTRLNLNSTDGTVTITEPPALAPTITIHPMDQVVMEGEMALFSVGATGTAPLSYQWQEDGINIVGATSPTYMTPPTVLSINGSVYRCMVSNGAGSATSNGATLTVNPRPIPPSLFFRTPQPDETMNGTTVEVRYGASGDLSGVDHVHLQLDVQPEVRDLDFDGLYTFTNVSSGPHTLQGYLATVDHAKILGTDASVSFTTVVNIPPNITAHPSDQTVTEGQTVTFSVVATGTTPLLYQWQENGMNVVGATGSSYMTPATVLADSGSLYRCVVSNSAGSSTSNEATLTVSQATPGIVDLRVGSVTIRAGEVGTVPVHLDTHGGLVISMQIYLHYDATVLTPTLPADNPRASAGSAVPATWSFVANSPVPGEV